MEVLEVLLTAKRFVAADLCLWLCELLSSCRCGKSKVVGVTALERECAVLPLSQFSRRLHTFVSRFVMRPEASCGAPYPF